MSSFRAPAYGVDVGMICINPEIIDVAPAIKMDLRKQADRSPIKPQGTSLGSSGALQANSRAELNTRVSLIPGVRHWDLPTCTRCASTDLHTLCHGQ